MFYKNWPYWLKGGIVFTFIIALIFLLLLYIQLVIFNIIPVFAFILLLPGTYITVLITQGKCFFEFMGPLRTGCMLDVVRWGYLTFVIIISSVFYFLVGSLLSLFYKKIKIEIKNKNTTVVVILILAFMVILWFIKNFVLKELGYKL